MDENGIFKDKSLYREAKEDFVVLEEVVMEVEAQYLRLVEMTGRKPFMVEAHAVPSANFNKALAIVGQKYGLTLMGFNPSRGPKLGSHVMKFSMDSGNADHNPFSCRSIYRMPCIYRPSPDGYRKSRRDLYRMACCKT